jgi:hypothetical protein
LVVVSIMRWCDNLRNSVGTFVCVGGNCIYFMKNHTAVSKMRSMCLAFRSPRYIGATSLMMILSCLLFSLDYPSTNNNVIGQCQQVWSSVTPCYNIISLRTKSDPKSADARLNDSIRIAALTGDIGYSERVVDRAKESHNECDGRIFPIWDG